MRDTWPKTWRVTGWLLAAGALCGLQWLGDQLVALLGWPLPGSLAGLLMLLGLLTLRGGVPRGLDEVAAPLLRHLMLFLIPSVAAVGLYAHLLLEHVALFVLTATLGTVVTIVVTGWTLHRLLKDRQP
ncbi:CidA/LrgA family protein [Hydrogenophaga laconesensis]|uniref:Holin-like protein n=1 Tax=Hydrogenophaga laconesensis TaxID=1805971 RepID=A0ABU1V4T0_9BURK|nr:CidA/LrgA family protein [Hydrogenophaga laconesensis]MDR7092434.1 holin-like protein [Hydrogenophaga laconesensis]